MISKGPYLLGADVGTSSCKTVLIDAEGHVISSDQRSYPTMYPRPGWAEQNPEDWYRTFCQSVRQILDGANVSPEDIVAVSITGPAHNAVLLDQKGIVLRPVIHWSDRRSEEQCQWLQREHGEMIFEITFQPVNPSWTLAQLLWIKHSEPEIWDKVRRMMVQKDYVVYRLTGAFNTDEYDAMGTQLFDARRKAWSEEACAILELPISCLPTIGKSTDVSGYISKTAAEETGLIKGIPVAIGSGDSVVEALAMGVVDPGQAIVKLATSGAVNVVSKEPHPHLQKMTYPHVMPDLWFNISATNSGAASALWLRGIINLSEDDETGFQQLEKFASEVDAGSEGLLFHPYLEGERAPYWDPQLRGDFVGLTVRHDHKHLARAVLEGVGFSLRDCRAMMQHIGLEFHDLYLLGGGARSQLWAQIIVNIFNTPMGRFPKETTAFGAALMAGMAGEVFEDLVQVRKYKLQADDVLSPQQEAVEVYDRLFRIYQHTTQVLIQINHDLSGMKVA